MKLKLTDKSITEFLTTAWKEGVIPYHAAVYEIMKAVREYTDAMAELAGTNSAIDDERKAALFLKHRAIAQDLQHKWITVGVGEPEEE